MNLQDNCLTMANFIAGHCLHASEVDVDGADKEASIDNSDGASASFNMTKWIDKPNPDGRIFKTEPVGRITYKVTVTAHYEPFDS